jgi:alkaline phosphatase
LLETTLRHSFLTSLAKNDVYIFLYFSQTYIIDQQVPDSAPTATALLSGVKCRNGVIGATQDVIRFDCSSLAGNEAESVMTKAIRDKGEKWRP